MPRATNERVMALVRERGVLRPRDLSALGLDPNYLTRLERTGRLERIGRGLYVSADAAVDEHHTLAEVSKRAPHGVVCLLSALRFHEIGTQNPYQIWLAIDRDDRAPKEPRLPLRIVRFSGQAMRGGTEEHLIEGVPVRVYSPAKTVADCFKYRNKIGIDVALEALREVRRERRATMDEIWRYAQVDRVANVMRPYLDSLA
ncbi:MAG: type IV toxin-antitoxin system AbiEi family antitoxin domain-containing protein [Dehalococcoidia bacterium]